MGQYRIVSKIMTSRQENVLLIYNLIYSKELTPGKVGQMLPTCLYRYFKRRQSSDNNVLEVEPAGR